MKASKGFHSTVVFLCFVVVSTVFWFILAMNDSVTKTFDVSLKIVNVPDSVTLSMIRPTIFMSRFAIRVRICCGQEL